MLSKTGDKKTDRERPACLCQCGSWAQILPIGHLRQNLCLLVTVVPPVCLLADTSNNPDIWPASKLITTLRGIDPSSRGIPSRAMCSWSLLLLRFMCFLLVFPFLFIWFISMALYYYLRCEWGVRVAVNAVNEISAQKKSYDPWRSIKMVVNRQTIFGGRSHIVKASACWKLRRDYF